MVSSGLTKSKLVQNVSAERDGGSTASVLSILLTEIQENKSNIMFAFTANRVEMLPPEFIDRAGARFLFNYPNQDEQLEILKIHIAKMRRFDPNNLTQTKGVWCVVALTIIHSWKTC